MFGVSVSKMGDVVVVAAEGEIDLATAPRMDEAVTQALSIGTTPGVVLDLSHVTFMSASGFAILARANEAMPEGSKVAVVAAGRAVTRPIELLGGRSFCSVYPTRSAAISDGKQRGN